MVFYVIACSLQGKEEQELERYVATSLGQGSRALGEHYTFNVTNQFTCFDVNENEYRSTRLALRSEL